MLQLIVAILLLGCAAEAIFIVLERKGKLLAALLLKSAASLSFVFSGAMALGITNDPPFAKLVLAGLALGALGDICLNLRFLLTARAKPVFMAGIAAFLLGHIAYLSALITRAPNALFFALPASALAALLIVRFVLARVEVQGTLRIFGVVYLCIVILMAACAVALFALAPSDPAHALFAFGGALFAASDVLLILNQFGKRPYPAFRILNLSFYYLGQVCIALTIALAR